LNWLLGGALILLSVWTVFYLEIDAWVLMGLTTVAVGAGLVWPAWPARVPRIVHTLAFPAIVAFFLGDLSLEGEVLPATGCGWIFCCYCIAVAPIASGATTCR